MSDLLTEGGEAPLADLRVIAVEQFGAGPFGTLQLADLGADVIKVEDPVAGGDVSRYVPPFQDGEDSLFFEAFNRGKRSVSLDLRHPDGRRVFEDLVRGADAVFSNLRGDGPDKLRLTYDDLQHLNPRIVCCSLSGYGNTGPRRNEGAYDYVIQGLAGWMSLTGGPDEPPMKSGLSLVDLAGGYVAAIALLSGVWRARRDGIGGDCDLSLFETALSLLTHQGTWAASRGFETERLSNSAHASIVPFQVFPTADGYLVVACAKEKFWQRLVAVLRRPDLADDERFTTFAGRREHRSPLQRELTAEFLTASTDEWVTTLREVGIPAQPVNSITQALDDPQVHARAGIVESEHETLGTVRHLASPLRVGARPQAISRGPFRGEHTAALLREICGYDETEIARLAQTGAIDRAPAKISAAATPGGRPGHEERATG
jgi:crotonobetainyl-CoA:carnitine CoA-transferase CaiB-like acyl-CoA transferase